MPIRIPKYRRRADRDGAFSQLNYKRFYFPGRYDSPESKEAYGRFVQRFLLQQRTLDEAPEPKPEGHTIGELALAYLEFAKHYYLRDGRPTSEYHLMRSAIKPLLQTHLSTPADTFGPRDLRAVRTAMIDLGWARGTVNDAVGRIRRLFRWGVEHELVPVTVLNAIQAMAPLKRGRTVAPEGRPVMPAPTLAVDAVLPLLPAVVADMVRLQRVTGMRSESLCTIRPVDIDRAGNVWLYRPASHKGDWRGGELLVPIGPQGQTILGPYLERPADAYCFSPAESERNRSASRRAIRKSPMTPSQAARSTTPRRKRPLRSRYTPTAYRRAIRRVIDRANLERKATGNPLLPTWHPHQLRHSVATAVRQRFGLEAAQVVLGHSRADVTQIYAERDLDLARRVALEMG